MCCFIPSTNHGTCLTSQTRDLRVIAVNLTTARTSIMYASPGLSLPTTLLPSVHVLLSLTWLQVLSRRVWHPPSDAHPPGCA
jgi:hypothetical protein